MRFPNVGAVYDRPQSVRLHSSTLWAVIDRPYSRIRIHTRPSGFMLNSASFRPSMGGRTVAQSFKLSRILFFVLMIPAVFVLAEGTKITPPQNKFALSHDVEVGREAAAQVRQELPLLPENGDIDAYVKRVGQGLVAAIPSDYSHPEFRYEFRVVNVSDINAFALPGGPMFVNRGMIESAHNEGEMAGVMAHEISHVALRHGTAQETKAQKPGIQLGALGAAVL